MATERESGNYHYKFKLILIGNSGVGKSCIFGRLKNPQDHFQTNLMFTISADFYTDTIQVEDKTIKIQLYDTAGQEKFRSITSSYYRNTVGGFLVFDVMNRTSFDDLNLWLEDVKKYAQPREPTLVLVGNKIDLAEKTARTVSRQEAKQLANRFGMDYIETSAKTGQNMDELLPFLASRVYWKLRVKEIVLEDGWVGVTKGELCTQKPLYIQDSNARSASSNRCCN